MNVIKISDLPNSKLLLDIINKGSFSYTAKLVMCIKHEKLPDDCADTHITFRCVHKESNEHVDLSSFGYVLNKDREKSNWSKIDKAFMEDITYLLLSKSGNKFYIADLMNADAEEFHNMKSTFQVG